MRKCFAVLTACFIFLLQAASQETFPLNGAPFRPRSVYAFINANIWQNDGSYLNNGTLVIREGKILSVSQKGSAPPEAIVYDLKGKFIYPSFIDICSDYGMPVIVPGKKERRMPQMESNLKGAFGWNQAIRSEVKAKHLFVHNADKALQLKKNGFGAVLSYSRDGIVRGSGVLAMLNSNRRENESILLAEAAAFYSFNKGSSTQDYPSSLTGAIALLRQTYYDAAWYKQNKELPEFNITLHEFNTLQQLPSVFEANDKYDALRAARIGSEFNVKYIIRGGGNEYQRISDISNTGLRFILPLDFPPAYDVEDVYDAEAVTLSELKHWEMAPSNPAFLEKHKVEFCFTTEGLKDISAFLKNLRLAVRYGLTEKQAINALTASPAKFINAGDRIGSLNKNYYANFFISDKSIFEDDAVIMQHWVAGEPVVFADIESPDLRGKYTLSLDHRKYELKFSGNLLHPKAEITIDTVKRQLRYTFVNNILSFNFLIDSGNVFRAAGNYNPESRSFSGRGRNGRGEWSEFEMLFSSMAEDSVKKIRKPELPEIGEIIFPFTAYGEPLPGDNGLFRDAWNKFKGRYSAILIKNATVWTNEAEGVLQDHDVYIVDGKIVRIAPNIDAPKLAFAKVIDAKGRHLTAGIIDEHSHIALTRGVNEGARASSAEVRMADVINPEDINIYRQLSGGVTTSQLLHGSANPIGGQSALIKLRWGHNAENLLFENADPFIKFALGENVKQSNWGDHQTVRFPQSRMGVEQVFNDYFTRAREYAANKARHGKKEGFRIDLELEAVAEILEKKRFITCHSYVQSEINMLMHVADSFGFNINTFTHILEGYKLADKMKKHGVHASTFSDWWAYKNEVMDAIPYNAALLTQMGVITAINSDDAEMARRLNQEAAKAVKYGGLSETEALRLVTINPAKMLHIDNKVGSIKVGKSADVVLWTAHPLSIYAMADKTIIDGRIYFDRERDKELREYVKSERARIIAKLLNEKQKGNPVVKPAPKTPKLYHCDTLEGYEDSETE